MTSALDTIPTPLSAPGVNEQLSLFGPNSRASWFEPPEPPHVLALVLALALIVVPWSLIGWMISMLV